MTTLIVRTTTVLFLLAASGPAWAYSHANNWGGSTSHSFGSTSHTSTFGTSTTHEAGVGTSHSNVYGGTTAHSVDGGTVHTTPYGGAGYRPPAGYYGYHPPTTASHYGAQCYNCGSGWATAGAAAAGAAMGAAAGAAAASSSAAVATAGAFNAGVAAGVSMAAAPYAIGQIAVTLPAGCVTPEVGGKSYYLCGNTWFATAYGANGVYYKVVPAP